VVLDVLFESLWRLAQQVEHGPKVERVSVFAVRQCVAPSRQCADQGLIHGLMVVRLVMEDESLDGDEDLEEARHFR
jgi:hypothetical protein